MAGRLNARPERPDLFIKNLTGIASLALLPLAFCRFSPKGLPADSWREPTQAKIYNISLMVGQTTPNSPDFSRDGFSSRKH
jgi:hypothetical protein